MATEIRDALRAKVIETLLSTFPGAQKVIGGVAYHSDVVDEETGMLFPVELKVTVKNTKDTARSKAYDLDAEVEKAANRPGKRVADPAKKAEREANSAAAAERKAANLAILKSWVTANLPAEGMISKQILEACADLSGLNPMMIGTLMNLLADEGIVTYSLDEKRRKVWTLVD